MRARSTNTLDYELLAEEVEDMGKRDLRECASRTLQILIHLWKLASTQGDEPKGHWKAEIRVQRTELDNTLTPSLRQMVEDRLEKLHWDGHVIVEASFQSDEPAALPLDPERRWTLAQILGERDDPIA